MVKAKTKAFGFTHGVRPEPSPSLSLSPRSAGPGGGGGTGGGGRERAAERARSGAERNGSELTSGGAWGGRE